MSNKNEIINYDFVNLYPSSNKDWTKDKKFMAELKKQERKTETTVPSK